MDPKPLGQGRTRADAQSDAANRAEVKRTHSLQPVAARTPRHRAPPCPRPRRALLIAGGPWGRKLHLAIVGRSYGTDGLDGYCYSNSIFAGTSVPLRARLPGRCGPVNDRPAPRRSSPSLARCAPAPPRASSRCTRERRIRQERVADAGSWKRGKFLGAGGWGSKSGNMEPCLKSDTCIGRPDLGPG